jgi:hypothetical protein
MLKELTSRWSLAIDAPFDHANVTCSWVAAVRRTHGPPVVLKLAFPTWKAQTKFIRCDSGERRPRCATPWADDELDAMLLERCLPGDMLRSEPEEKQDVVIAALLTRLWATIHFVERYACFSGTYQSC